MGVVWVRMGVVPIGYFGWGLFCTHWVLGHQLAAEIPDWLCFIHYYLTHIHAATLTTSRIHFNKLLHQSTIQVNINIILCLSVTSYLIGSLQSAGLTLIQQTVSRTRSIIPALSKYPVQSEGICKVIGNYRRHIPTGKTQGI